MANPGQHQISASEARNKLSEMLGRVEAGEEVVIISRSLRLRVSSRRLQPMIVLKRSALLTLSSLPRAVGGLTVNEFSAEGR